MPARCICGHSSTYPLCDGKHREAGWRCSSAGAEHQLVILAAEHLGPLGERLAHEQSGVALHRCRGSVVAQTLVVLTDGTDLEQLAAMYSRVEAGNVKVLGIGVPAHVASGIFVAYDGYDVLDKGSLWDNVLVALEGPAATPKPLTDLFLSHSVDDEAQLQPAVDLLRNQAQLDVFFCADSIAQGSRWQEEIESALGRFEVIVFLASAASIQSTFCAYECGISLGRGKAVYVISLDGTPPPAYLADRQAYDIPRICRRKPWLTPTEALTEALLSIAAT